MSNTDQSLPRRLAETAALLALLVGLMLWLAGSFTAKAQPGPPVPDTSPPAQRAAAARSVPITEFVEQVGTIRSRSRADIASKLLAQVIEVRVEAGDRVTGASADVAASVVAVLDSADLRAALARAQAQDRAGARAVRVQEAEVAAAEAFRDAVRARLTQTEADLKRTRSLVEQGVGTPEQLDRAQAGRDVALADLAAATSRARAAEEQLARAREEGVVAQRQVEEAQVLLGYTQLRAPFGGVVTEKLVETGDMVRPGQAVVRVEDPSRLELHAAVAESLAAGLSLGKPLDVRVDALGGTLTGTVREVAPAADPASRTFSVKLSLPATPGLQPGLFGRLRIPVRERQAVVVPVEAVRTVGQLDLVDVVVDGLPHRRFVLLGARHERDGAQLVEVVSGLSAGEQVALP